MLLECMFLTYIAPSSFILNGIGRFAVRNTPPFYNYQNIASNVFITEWLENIRFQCSLSFSGFTLFCDEYLF